MYNLPRLKESIFLLVDSKLELCTYNHIICKFMTNKSTDLHE